jgi:dTDP-4-amino-4,6-dideoxygalactose transaminase
VYAVRVNGRDQLQRALTDRGIATGIHYPIPIPRQAALTSEHPSDCPVAARVCDEILSLPLHPTLADDDVSVVAAAIRSFH